jgi:hypothetical protein
MNILQQDILEDFQNLPLMRQVSSKHATFKINNPQVKNFLLKYTQIDPSDEKTLRTNYPPEGNEEILKKIQVLCRKENFWASID